MYRNTFVKIATCMTKKLQVDIIIVPRKLFNTVLETQLSVQQQSHSKAMKCYHPGAVQRLMCSSTSKRLSVSQGHSYRPVLN